MIGKLSTRTKWYEKWEKSVDYWENYYESETHFEQVSLNLEDNTSVARKGHKEFKNNKNYYRREEWEELSDG